MSTATLEQSWTLLASSVADRGANVPLNTFSNVANFWRCMHDCSELMRAQPPTGLLRLVRSSAVESIACPTFSELKFDLHSDLFASWQNVCALVVGESCLGAKCIAAVSFEHSTLGVFSLRVWLDVDTDAGERDDFVYRTLFELGSSTSDTSIVSFCEASSNNVCQPFQYSARFDSVAAASAPSESSSTCYGVAQLKQLNFLDANSTNSIAFHWNSVVSSVDSWSSQPADSLFGNFAPSHAQDASMPNMSSLSLAEPEQTQEALSMQKLQSLIVPYLEHFNVSLLEIYTAESLRELATEGCPKCLGTVTNSICVVLQCKLNLCRHIVHVDCLLSDSSNLPTMYQHHGSNSFRVLPLPDISHFDIHSGVVFPGQRRCSMELEFSHIVSNANILRIEWPFQLTAQIDQQTGKESLMCVLDPQKHHVLFNIQNARIIFKCTDSITMQTMLIDANFSLCDVSALSYKLVYADPISRNTLMIGVSRKDMSSPFYVALVKYEFAYAAPSQRAPVDSIHNSMPLIGRDAMRAGAEGFEHPAQGNHYHAGQWSQAATPAFRPQPQQPMAQQWRGSVGMPQHYPQASSYPAAQSYPAQPNYPGGSDFAAPGASSSASRASYSNSWSNQRNDHFDDVDELELHHNNGHNNGLSRPAQYMPPPHRPDSPLTFDEFRRSEYEELNPANMAGPLMTGIPEIDNPALVGGLSMIDHVRGRVYMLSKSQGGSRFVQQKLDENDIEYLHLFFHELCPHVSELMMDSFAHYAIEKLIRKCSTAQRLDLLQALTSGMTGSNLSIVACHKQGSFSLQSAMDSLSTEAEIAIFGRAIEVDIIRLSTSSSGHFVVLRYLQHFPQTPYAAAILEAISEACLEIASDHHGLRVFKTIVDLTPPNDLHNLYKAVARQTMKLAENQYGNYCVQHVLDHAPPVVCNSIKMKMEGKFVRLARQKFSSNVVEKCLRTSPPEWRAVIIRELCSSIGDMIRDRYGNYVLQTAVALADPQQVIEFVRAVVPHLGQLRENVRTKWSKIIKTAAQAANIPPNMLPNLNVYQMQMPSQQPAMLMSMPGYGSQPSQPNMMMHQQRSYGMMQPMQHMQHMQPMTDPRMAMPDPRMMDPRMMRR